MTLTRFVTKSAFRNKRRSILTVASIAFSLLLLSIMLSVWRGFYIDKGAPDSALRIMTRHKVSLANFLPIYYRDKIRAVRVQELEAHNQAVVTNHAGNIDLNRVFITSLK